MFSHYKRYTYFVSSRLTNKIFVEQIQNEGDSSSIERIKQAFDVEPVTKQFYEEIQSWYFMAMDQVEFP
jgi:adenine-specific DNA-methyltransferase